MSRPHAFDRLQKLVGDKKPISPNNIGAVIDKYTNKTGVKVPGGGVVTKHMNYRESIGHLGENKGHNAAKPGGFLVTNPNKGTTEPGLDRGYLFRNKNGKFAFNAVDDKAHQKVGKISRVSALQENLETNLQTQQQKSLVASRNKAIPYGERVLARATSMTLTKILGNVKRRDQRRAIGADGVKPRRQCHRARSCAEEAGSGLRGRPFQGQRRQARRTDFEGQARQREVGEKVWSERRNTDRPGSIPPGDVAPGLRQGREGEASRRNRRRQLVNRADL